MADIKKKSKVKSKSKGTKETVLTLQEKLFCRYYIKYLNGTKAAIEAGYSEVSAHVIASRLLRRDKIRQYISELAERKFQAIDIQTDAILFRLLKIGYCDLTEFAEWGTREETIVGEDGKEKKVTVNYVTPFPSKEIDGTLVREVGLDKDGNFKIKLHDPMPSLRMLAEYKKLLKGPGNIDNVTLVVSDKFLAKNEFGDE